jgi:hypothetical protein
MSDDTHSYQIHAGTTPEGESVTIYDAPHEQAHHWHEGTAPPGSRIVQDEFGNMVAWNSDTGEVITAQRQHDPSTRTTRATRSRRLTTSSSDPLFPPSGHLRVQWSAISDHSTSN